MLQVNLATSATCLPDDPDIRPLQRALQAKGVYASVVDWRSSFGSRADLTIIRSCWDYVSAPQRFLEWVYALNNVRNEAHYVAWNYSKTYLLQLADLGCPVPTTVVAPSSETEIPSAAGWVVKPLINSSARYTYRTQTLNATIHAMSFLENKGHTPIVQPYIQPAGEFSEVSLVFLRGHPLHAASKDLDLPVAENVGPLPDTARAHYLPTNAAPHVWSLGRSILAALHRVFPSQAPPLYARVDLLEDHWGALHLLELELIEPSLCLSLFPESEYQVASAILLDLHAERDGAIHGTS